MVTLSRTLLGVLLFGPPIAILWGAFGVAPPRSLALGYGQLGVSVGAGAVAGIGTLALLALR